MVQDLEKKLTSINKSLVYEITGLNSSPLVGVLRACITVKKIVVVFILDPFKNFAFFQELYCV